MNKIINFFLKNKRDSHVVTILAGVFVIIITISSIANASSMFWWSPYTRWEYFINDRFEDYGIKRMEIVVMSNTRNFLLSNDPCADLFLINSKKVFSLNIFKHGDYFCGAEYPPRIELSTKFHPDSPEMELVSKYYADKLKEKYSNKGYKVVLVKEQDKQTVKEILKEAHSRQIDAVAFVLYNPYKIIKLPTSGGIEAFPGVNSRTYILNIEYYELKGLFILPTVYIYDTKSMGRLWSFRNYGVVEQINRKSHPFLFMGCSIKGMSGEEIIDTATGNSTDEIFNPTVKRDSEEYKDLPIAADREKTITNNEGRIISWKDRNRAYWCEPIDWYDGFFFKFGYIRRNIPPIEVDICNDLNDQVVNNNMVHEVNLEDIFVNPAEGFCFNIGLTVGKIMWNMETGVGMDFKNNYTRTYIANDAGSLVEHTLSFDSLYLGYYNTTLSYIFPVKKSICLFLGVGAELGGGTFSGEDVYTSPGDYSQSTDYFYFDYTKNMFFIQPGLCFKSGIFTADIKPRVNITYRRIDLIVTAGIIF